MLLLSSALVLGFLHGLGADHLMAIAALSVDGRLATVAARRTRAFGVAVRFAIGHALLLGAGAGAIVLAGWTIPAALERDGEILGGALLVFMGAVALWGLISGRVYGHAHGDGHEPRPHWHVHLAARGGSPASHRDGRGAPLARRDDREYCLYLRKEQHSQRGCIARRMQPDLHHGLLGQPGHAGHSHLPTIIGAAFAISSLRALAMLTPFGAGIGSASLPLLLSLVALFAAGVLLSMSLFGVALARVLSTNVLERIGEAAGALVAVSSIVLGLAWVVTA